MTPRADGASRRVRVAALLVIAALVAGPLSTHVYWMLGGAWGLHRSVGGHVEQSTTTGIRVVAALVVVLLVAAVLVVLARVGLWQQSFVSYRLIRFFAWTTACFSPKSRPLNPRLILRMPRCRPRRTQGTCISTTSSRCISTRCGMAGP